eukprot:CAMPEP_0184310686 /NCGR_PEP_ID=MMETSP1049-20130417/33386_1 /TAXON_ID=77928 /ORGANISM="Proteomonas sulcata, Strain CCMP704" /LENGTH=63 /DNA_ID=CAMNT_0026625181 /DNA_START=9 /DNA_END=200 /DNA_ORIENTATION=+
MFSLLHSMLWENDDETQAKGISEDVRKEMMSACKLQSSCNLTKQADAKKAKKSLNIIHIGNIY